MLRNRYEHIDAFVFASKIALMLYKYSVSLMAYCSALLKSEKPCPSKAKYILEEYNLFYCKTHALAHSNLKMNTTYESIDDVPNLHELGTQAQLSDNTIGEILSDMYHTHDRRITVISKKKIKTGYEMIVADAANLAEKYILKVAKAAPHIEQMMDTSAAYAGLLPNLTKPICVPLVSYMQDGNRLCLVRGWKYGHWYYELGLISHPLLMTDHKKLIICLVELITYAQDHRLVYGSIELRNLAQLKQKRISTTVFESLKNASFWQGRYGQTVECDTPLDSDVSFDSLTCARRMNQKLHPCRYDDFESILYLALHLLNHQLPWSGLLNNSDIANEKTNFLTDQASKKTHSPLVSIAQMILDSHFDDRPNYPKLLECFSAMM